MEDMKRNTNTNSSNTNNSDSTPDGTAAPRERRGRVAYVVRETNTRRFLNRPAYSGRLRGIWGRIDTAAYFETRAQAQSCASNINARRPYGYSAYTAEVRSVLVEEPMETAAPRRRG